MNVGFAAALIAVSFALSGSASAASPVAECQDRLQQKIDRLNARMRVGYSARSGEKLKVEWKRLTDLRGTCARNPGVWKTVGG